MKAKSHSKLTFSQAVNGYLLAAQSRHLSQHTIDEYLNTFRKFQTFIDDDPPLITLSPAVVQAFLAAQTVSKKTILIITSGCRRCGLGVRAEELCELRIHQVDMRNWRLTVLGKGSKERTIRPCNQSELRNYSSQ